MQNAHQMGVSPTSFVGLKPFIQKNSSTNGTSGTRFNIRCALSKRVRKMKMPVFRWVRHISSNTCRFESKTVTMTEFVDNVCVGG